MIKRICVCVVVVVLVISCAADSKKEDVGTVVGAVLGGVLGSRVGKGDGRIVGAVLGTVAGGLIGKKFGAYLDEQDRKKIAEASDKAIREGNPEVYVSEKSGTKVTMTPSKPVYETGPQLAIAKGVDSTAPLVLEKDLLQTNRATSIRLSPAESGKVKYRLDRGAYVDVVATVRDSEWVLVADDTVAMGYIKKSDLSPSGTVTDQPAKQVAEKAGEPKTSATQPSKKAIAKAKPRSEVSSNVKTAKPASQDQKPDTERLANKADVPQTTTSNDPATQTDAIPKTQPAPTPIAKEQADPANIQKVSLTTECKVLTRTIEVPDGGPSGKEDIKYCKEPPKGWHVVSA